MERLYGAEELAERWHCAICTAKDRMREIGTIGRPMMCRESTIEEWEREQEKRSLNKAPGIPKGGARRRDRITPIKQGPLKPGQFISRIRVKAE